MVGGLLDVPAEAEAEREAARGEVVEGRDLLGEVDRVVLGDQRDAGAEAEALGDRGGLAERDEGVEGAAVLGRQLAARRVRRHALHRDVRVLGQIQTGETALLQLTGEPDGGDGLVGEEDRHGDAHVPSVPAWNPDVHTDQSAPITVGIPLTSVYMTYRGADSLPVHGVHDRTRRWPVCVRTRTASGDALCS